MQAGDVVSIACQCMTGGKKWPINSIRVSQTQAFDPYFLPTGQGILMYSKYHGNNFLAIKQRFTQTFNRHEFHELNIFKNSCEFVKFVSNKKKVHNIIAKTYHNIKNIVSRIMTIKKLYN